VARGRALVPLGAAMAHESDPRFRVLHALRIKGFAKADLLAELAAVQQPDVEAQLAEFQAAELAQFREARALWQLTAKGRDVHAAQLTVDAEPVREALRAPYEAFLELNESFKELCGAWQLRNGSPNDHSDDVYDKGVINRLLATDARAQPIVEAMGVELTRLAPYGPRLAATARRVADGDHQRFTGVMCGSYHDVWMELHEDLILTLGVDRAAEGSF
jgi:hypothetical protein